MKGHYHLLLIGLISLAGCKQLHNGRHEAHSTKPPQGSHEPAKKDPIVKTTPAYPYRPSQTKAFDLIHTRLEVDFDIPKQQMHGKAELQMRPWFAPQDHVVLDGKGFVLHSVGLQINGSLKPLKYTYDNEHIDIALDRSYARTETLTVAIDYTARPSELDSLVSADAAGDQGLYFINPKCEEKGKPTEIWTQGESHGSPGWFPTFDTPNQRCTNEILITVPDSFTTLSNGILKHSDIKPGGLRTDDWVMELPHAPYLFTMAIGNYVVVKDQWRGKEVSYYVEPKYAPYARTIFGHTPEMIEFFSTKLGVDFPWPKYAQVVVRDFVSGAMENTSATTHFERLQHDARQHLDNSFEDIVSHELFHQWFGDLVTCESWANLSLNEGFATYGEYLWNEYKYGHDEATLHLLEDREAYIRSSKRDKFPIIRYHHRDAESMFDAHSYQKGGQVLHMLRKQVGDEAFFAALKRYLTVNAFDDVEIHELRLAFEEVTGEDLNWFFDQWFLSAGHPELIVTHAYENGTYSLQVQQVQDQKVAPVFQLPLTIEYSLDGKPHQMQVVMTNADTTFKIPAAQRPDYVALDPEQDLLMDIVDESGLEQSALLYQATHTSGYARQAAAIDKLDAHALEEGEFKQLIGLLKEPFWGVREDLIPSLGSAGEGVQDMAYQENIALLHDPNVHVRTSALLSLHSNLGGIPQSLRQQAADALLRGIADSSYTVSQFSLETYCALMPEAGLAKIKELMLHPEPHLSGMISKVVKDTDSPEALDYILQSFQNPATETGAKIAMLRGMGTYLKKQAPDKQRIGTTLLMDVAKGHEPRWLRMTALQSLGEMDRTEEIKAFFTARSVDEEDAMVKMALQRLTESH